MLQHFKLERQRQRCAQMQQQQIRASATCACGAAFNDMQFATATQPQTISGMRSSADVATRISV
jgi:hypothetical protein